MRDAVLNVVAGMHSPENLGQFRALDPSRRTSGFIREPSAIRPLAVAGVKIIRLWPQWIRGEDGERRGPIPVDCEGVENHLVERVRRHGRPVRDPMETGGSCPLFDHSNREELRHGEQRSDQGQGKGCGRQD